MDRMENHLSTSREQEGRVRADESAVHVGAQGSGKVRPDGGPATIEDAALGGKLLTDAPKIRTDEGRQKLDGVIART